MTDPSRSPSAGLRIASIAGVPVYLGWSWFALAAVITVVVGTGAGAVGYVIGLVYAVVLLLAVLAHEGAHALMARRLGLVVHRVVADFLGGHTAFDSRALTPGRAAAVAAAGPLTNLLLALVGWLGAQAVQGTMAGLVLGGIGWVNLLLALFNLLPALPLDGGQILESLVWGVTGRRASGLLVAGWAGRVLAVLIVLWAVGLPLVQGRTPDLIRIVWAGFIASVIWRGAGQAIASSQARAALEGRTIDQVARPVTVIPGSLPVGSLGPTPGIPLVREGGRYLLLGSPGEGVTVPPDTPVSALGTALPEGAVVESAPGDELVPALTTMQSSRSSVVVLTDGGQPWAIAIADDLNTLLGS